MMERKLHKAYKPELVNAANLINQVFKSNPVGGNLHVVIDDGNLDDESLMQASLTIAENFFEVSNEALTIEKECLNALRELSYFSRLRVWIRHKSMPFAGAGN